MSGGDGEGPARAHVLILRQSEPFPYGWVGQQARALAAAGYRVTAITPTGLGYDAPDETLEGVRVLRFAAPAGARSIVAYLREYASALTRMASLIRRVRRESTVDCVIVSTPPDFLMVLALPLRRRGAAVIFDQRDPAPELFEAKFGRRGPIHRLLVGLERVACGTADVVMPHNETCAELLRSRGGVDRSRTFVVGVGPDPARIFPVPARPELRRGKEFLVLWIGTMSTQEGLEQLVEAAEEIVHVHGRRDVAFAIVGPGDARPALLEQVQQRGLGDVVDMPGVVTDAELIRAYMATADVCVSVDPPNPMNHASTMMKVLEYMAMGRPVVQFPLLEMARLCGDTTVYASPGDPSDLAKQILALLDDPSWRHRLGDAARRRVLDGSMWTDQVGVLVAGVEAALRARRARPARRARTSK